MSDVYTLNLLLETMWKVPGTNSVETFPIMKMKAQRLLYIYSCEYVKKYGELPGQPFSMSPYGPYHPFINDMYSGTCIDSYCCAKDNTPFLAGERAIMKNVIQSFGDVNHIFLSNILRREGSAWDIAFQNEERFIDPEDMKNDESYVEFLTG